MNVSRYSLPKPNPSWLVFRLFSLYCFTTCEYRISKKSIEMAFLVKKMLYEEENPRVFVSNSARTFLGPWLHDVLKAPGSEGASHALRALEAAFRGTYGDDVSRDTVHLRHTSISGKTMAAPITVARGASRSARQNSMEAGARHTLPSREQLHPPCHPSRAR